MSGAIMPEPLQNPLRRTVAPSIVAVAVAPFGKVSVVIIARAATSHAPGASSAVTFGNAAEMRLAGGASPMTPVDEMNTSFGSQPNRRAAAAAVFSTTCQPTLPVNTFAFPELTTIARAFPAGRHCRHQITG